MNNLLYFPAFEPPTDDWLKFAILYVEDFSPIIPEFGERYLSDDYQRIIGETDLITPYSPKYDQGDRASIRFTDFIDGVLRDPYRFANLFNRPNIARDFERFGEGYGRNYEIFNAKFSFTLRNYCLENNFGRETNNGILVSEEFAFIYMAFLAEEIAHEEGKSIITDNNSFDNFLNYRRIHPRHVIDQRNFAQGVLQLAVPQNISTIPIRNLIQFRNSNRNKIRAFNSELTNTLNNLENRIDERGFVERFNNIYGELSAEILGQGLGMVTIPLGAYILFQDAAPANAEYINQIIAGIGLVLTGAGSISDKWRDCVNRHNCKRYLTNLRELR